ncbi:MULTISPECIES: DUF2797 domain-containing protein [unclassified Neptuniibacter]|jgi:hypothetical protein|uniref:DUF2797 domain-containing protein n=1 Tax=unclassified Neptuniibacter TaxID=2630693 RepID=UPI000C392D5E|nr:MULTISPECIES: DUF2797 domain-containing protein [unclassified Neptuniibacter]MAY41009.1 hypothetical protein [Oceanospirillaceae bacterium]|tara:strand:- start:14838 stop:15665 length:828 start_codon:yes stop_codon:yes gene_type:complete
MQQIACGALQKMRTELSDTVKYFLPVGDEEVSMNELIGKPISLLFQGAINCTHCGRKTKKSFNQGFCYPCFKKLPQCDQCIVKPELCHFHEGSCRDESWGEQFCFKDHYVYLANSSGVKVGITRGTQVPTRWMDQGAVQALPIFKVSTRLQSGKVERLLGEHVADKTNWRKMLKNEVDDLTLSETRDMLLEKCKDGLKALEDEFGIQAIQRLPDAEQIEINYPVLNYPLKVSSFNFDKTPEVTGVLQGIKGQYLILDTGVINMRKFTAYQVAISA